VKDQEGAVERLLRQVEARVAIKEELRGVALGLATTAAIVTGVLALLGLVLAGAIIFSMLMHALSA
jgi:hypothetical protein